MVAQPTTLTIWQPWASAIIHGPKRVENREWAPPHARIGTRLFIHAGRQAVAPDTLEDVAELWPGVRGADLVRGAIIGAVTIVGVVRTFEHARRALGDAGVAWYTGDVGWVLAEPVAFANPVAARGKLGLWTGPDEALDELARAEARHG